MSNEITRLYNTKEASEHLRLAHETVRTMCRQGKLPCRKLRNKYWLTADDLNKALSGE